MRAPAWTLEDALRAFRDDSARARAIAAGLDRETFNLRPAPMTWSVGECIDHLCVVGAQVQPRFEAALEATRDGDWTAEFGGELARISWVDRALVRGMGPRSDGEALFPVRAPERFQPATDLDPDRVLLRFDAVAAEYVAQLERGRGFDLCRVRVPSLLLPVVRPPVGAWYAAHAAHHDRHLLQAARARAALGVPAPAVPDAPLERETAAAS